MSDLLDHTLEIVNENMQELARLNKDNRRISEKIDSLMAKEKTGKAPRKAKVRKLTCPTFVLDGKEYTFLYPKFRGMTNPRIIIADDTTDAERAELVATEPQAFTVVDDIEGFLTDGNPDPEA